MNIIAKKQNLILVKKSNNVDFEVCKKVKFNDDEWYVKICEYLNTTEKSAKLNFEYM